MDPADIRPQSRVELPFRAIPDTVRGMPSTLLEYFQTVHTQNGPRTCRMLLRVGMDGPAQAVWEMMQIYWQKESEVDILLAELEKLRQQVAMLEGENATLRGQHTELRTRKGK